MLSRFRLLGDLLWLLFSVSLLLEIYDKTARHYCCVLCLLYLSALQLHGKGNFSSVVL